MPSRRHFWWTLQLQWFQWFLLEAVPHFARETWKGPQSCLGREMKADIRSGASFLTPWAPGLPCTDTKFQRSMQQHALLWCISESLDPRLVRPQIGAGTESLYRSQCSHRDDPLWITTNPHPCFILFLLKMTRNHWPFLPLGRIYSSPLASLRAFWSLEPQAYLVKTYIYPAKTCSKTSIHDA